MSRSLAAMACAVGADIRLGPVRDSRLGHGAVWNTDAAIARPLLWSVAPPISFRNRFANIELRSRWPPSLVACAPGRGVLALAPTAGASASNDAHGTPKNRERAKAGARRGAAGRQRERDLALARTRVHCRCVDCPRIAEAYPPLRAKARYHGNHRVLEPPAVRRYDQRRPCKDERHSRPRCCSCFLQRHVPSP